MQGDGIDVGVSGFAGIELGGTAQFVERVVPALEPHQRQSQRVMQAGILRGYDERGAQHVLAVGVAPELAIEIGEVGGGGRVMRAQTQRRLEFGFSFGISASLGEEGPECRA